VGGNDFGKRCPGRRIVDFCQATVDLVRDFCRAVVRCSSRHKTHWARLRSSGGIR
jgi:hypothetical protein